MLADHHGLQHRQMREQADVLERARDAAQRAPRGARVGDDVALEGDLPAIGREHAGHQIEERGLAGAVRSDQRMDVAARDLHAQIVQRIEAAEALAQALDREAGVRCQAWRAFQRENGRRGIVSRVSRPSGRTIIIRIRMMP